MTRLPLLLLLTCCCRQILDALASNLKREHTLRVMLNCFVWCVTDDSCVLYIYSLLPPHKFACMSAATGLSCLVAATDLLLPASLLI
jgi:hypothetical protein